MFEEKFFAHRKVNPGKLIRYGFAEEEGGYRYSAAVMENQFLLHVFISADGTVSTQMIDCASEEEYSLYKVTSPVGSYVGEVRAACEAILTEIAQTCCDPDVFSAQQTSAVIEYVRQTYGDELEHLWEKSPENAIWRRKDSRKWYGVILTIPKNRLGVASDEVVEIVDLRLKPEQMAETVDRERYFPGWHMNKKSWYTIVLDSSVPTEEICRRIDESYRLAVK